MACDVLTPGGRGLTCSTVTLGRGANTGAGVWGLATCINSVRAPSGVPEALPGIPGVAMASAMAAGQDDRSPPTTAAPQAWLPKFSALVSAKARNKRARSGEGVSSNAMATQRAQCS